MTSDIDPALFREMANRMVDEQLEKLKAAYVNGHRYGLVEAVQILREHRTEQPWPEWIRDGVAEELTTKIKKRRGRHANERTQRRDDVVDCMRATFVAIELIELGLLPTDPLSQDPEPAHVRVAAKAVSEKLRGDAGGTQRVIELAYERFHKRVRQDPHRYHPLLTWRAHLILDALADAPAPAIPPPDRARWWRLLTEHSLRVTDQPRPE